MIKYGKIIGEIRKSKGYSQKFITEEVCSQGNYSKFEVEDNRDVKISILREFLNRLEISFEEFYFIENGYKMVPREKIVHQFYNQSYNSEKKLLKFLEECTEYLDTSPKDRYIFKIKTVLEAMIILSKSNDFTQSRELVLPIWKELSYRNDLYLSDIYLLNSILFIFSVDTATQIKEFAFRQIDKYQGFQNINKLKLNFILNLSFINIKIERYTDALDLIEQAIVKSKEENLFVILSTCYVRKGICLDNLEQEGGSFIKKGLLMLEHLEQFELLEFLKREINSTVGQ